VASGAGQIPHNSSRIFCGWFFATKETYRESRRIPPLLSQLSLEDVLKKLKSLNIDTVELGTGNYPAIRIAS